MNSSDVTYCRLPARSNNQLKSSNTVSGVEGGGEGKSKRWVCRQSPVLKSKWPLRYQPEWVRISHLLTDDLGISSILSFPARPDL